MFTPQELLTGLAVLILIFHISNLFNPKGFRKELKAFMSDANAVRLGGVFFLFISFLLLSHSWKLEHKWPAVIALFGWLVLLKGLTWIWSPKVVKKYANYFLIKDENKSVTVSIIAVLIALFLIYVAVQVIKTPNLAL